VTGERVEHPPDLDVDRELELHVQIEEGQPRGQELAAAISTSPKERSVV